MIEADLGSAATDSCEATPMLNAQEIQGQWNKIRGQVKAKWGQLTDDDLTIRSGNVDQLVGRIQQKTGEGRETIEKFLGDLTSHGASGITQVAESAREYAQQVGTTVQDAGEYVREGFNQMSDRAREQYDMAEDLVRQNPTQSVAVAFGIGVAFGLIVGLALRSR
jgi:uncharacterized protein YjbJ (UPF0337 family)